MDDFLLILENNLSIFLGILQVKKSCKEGSVLTPCCGRRSLIGVSYWKRMPVVSTENVSVFIPLILRGKVSGSGVTREERERNYILYKNNMLRIIYFVCK